MDQEKIGKFIAINRKKKKMTQQDLANILGVSDRTISKWENGRGLPDLSFLIPLSNALEVSINDLLTGEIVNKDNYQQSFEKNVLNIIEKNNKHNQKILDILAFISIIIIVIILGFVFLNMEIFKQDYDREKMFINYQENMLVFTTSYSGDIKYIIKKYNGMNIIFLNLVTSIKDNINNKNNDSINHVYGLNNIDKKFLEEKYKVYYTKANFNIIKKANVNKLGEIINDSYLIYEN